jgi:hypothetical protein
MRQGAPLLSAIAFAVSLISPPAAYADDDSVKAELQALRHELKELATRDQQQIEALQRQVRALSAKHTRTERANAALGEHTAPAAPVPVPVAPAPPAPPPAIAVLESPGNLPGRSAVPPYTGAGPGAPGAVSVVPASAVSSGGNNVVLSISGQVDRALLFGDDGLQAKLHQVDNNNSSTRFRIVGEAKPIDNTVAGMNLETEIRANSSASQTLTQNLPQPASAVTFTIRQAEAYMANPEYGGIRLGFGSTASYLTSENDLSGTAVASYVQVPDFDGGFAFRQRGAAMVPGGAGGGFVLSAANSYGPAVGSVFNYFDGLGRDDRIRYDSPVWDGFQISTSVLDSGFDFAGRFARKYDDFQIIASAAFGSETNRSHGQPGAYGYAGVPAGAGGISLGGTNSAPGSPTVADVSPTGSNQFDGSVSILLKSGLNFTVAGGVRDPNYRDPTGKSLSPNLIFAKLGYQQRFFPIGLTAFSIDFAQNEELIFAGDVARAYGLAAVQTIDDFGLDLYSALKYETLDRAFASYRPIVAVMTGARVRF